eukprot:TRINITY_DN3830_c0_g1_i1.p1 TRINITY_DN3830_c0_g1~~TRINITY_DN3830_c0_g1_i1.p1  ORF type:complete len:270 (-),score=40.51 TRINITY_DN3830_c0_g1_i1:96-905(-)
MSNIPSYVVTERWSRIWKITFTTDEKAVEMKVTLRFKLPLSFKTNNNTYRLLQFLGQEGTTHFKVLEPKAEVIKNKKAAEHYIEFKAVLLVSGYYSVGKQGDLEPCQLCKKDDRLEDQILCDDCDGTYHGTCLDPPIDIKTLGEDDRWSCPKCLAKEQEIKKNSVKTLSEKQKLSKGALCKRKWGGGNSCAGLQKRCNIVPQHHFGKIPGILVGKHWGSRINCHEDGVHRSTVGGIAGTSKLGACSIAVSGGYEDDDDHGDEFVYLFCH